MTTKSDARLTQTQLLNIVRTGRAFRGIGKVRALVALQGHQGEDLADVLLSEVANPKESPRIRHMAVIGLYRMGGTSAEEALMAASRHADELSAPTIAMALGRIGTVDRLAVIIELERVAAHHAKARAAFGATLLAYRHRLDGHDVRAPTEMALQAPGSQRSNPIQIENVGTDIAEQALDALTDEPLGVELTTERAIRIVCESDTFVWLWGPDTAARGFSAFQEQKGVGGVLASKHPIENTYSLSAIGLGTPTRSGVRLTIHQADTGTILYSGIFSPDGALDLRAKDHPGLAAVAISVRLQNGLVEVETAKSAAIVRQAKTPQQS